MNRLGVYKAAENMLNTIKSLAKETLIIIFLKIIMPTKVIKAEVTDNKEKKL